MSPAAANANQVDGGAVSDTFLASAQIYDPATGAWKGIGNMTAARYAHTATLLPNGTVLVAGGANIVSGIVYFASAEIYDPVAGT